MRAALYLAIVFPALAGTALAGVVPGATQEQIGTWVLECPGKDPCTLRFNKRFLEKAGITGDLEVLAQGKTLVPAIALRGLSGDMMLAASMAGKAEASLQFPGGPREDLDCATTAAGYICAPRDSANQRISAALALSRTVTVRVGVSMAGMSPLPSQEKSLDLSGTNEALAKLRSAGPSPVPSAMTGLASQSPEGLMGMADKMLKAAGYPNGTAQIQAMMAKYMSKPPGPK